jgi:hypothetical protein
MRNFLATVLSVIAAGVMLIAYGLLSPRAAATGFYAPVPPTLASERGGIVDLTSRQPIAYGVSDTRALPSYDELVLENASLRRAQSESVRLAPVTSRRVSSAPARVTRTSNRDWKKTAMVIGGSTAAGAGLGAIFGGKTGALIGAAIGGGAGTLLQAR